MGGLKAQGLLGLWSLLLRVLGLGRGLGLGLRVWGFQALGLGVRVQGLVLQEDPWLAKVSIPCQSFKGEASVGLYGFRSSLS